MVTDSRKFMLLYGSETGQSEAIAEQICKSAEEIGLNPSLHCLSQIQKSFDLKKENFAVFVISTTGDGDIPEKALKFWRILRKSSANSLSHLCYSLLALGDTNYTNFCNSGKKFDEKLSELGAKKFYATGFADDGTGLELVVEPWIDGLWSPLKLVLNSSENLDLITKSKDSETINVMETPTKFDGALLTESKTLSQADINVPALPKSVITYKFTDNGGNNDLPWEYIKLPSASSDIFLAHYVSGKYLTKEISIKRTVEVTLDIAGSGIKFVPGDSFGIVPENDSNEVEILLSRLNVISHQNKSLEFTAVSKKPVPAHLPSKTSLANIFKKFLEIRAVPKKAFLRALANHTSDENEQRRLLELCSRQGASEYQLLVRQPNLCLADILTAFPSCQPPLEVVLEHLPPISPRFYSVVNSPLVHPLLLKFALNIIEFDQSNGRYSKRLGVCTQYLENLVKTSLAATTTIPDKLAALSINNVNIPIYLRTNTSFKLPQNLRAPIIMIGPGTGVAPFIGFLDHLQFMVKNSTLNIASLRTWLFFGCRHKERDFLYESEIVNFNKGGILKDLSVSFSRDGNGPKYVQDNIKIRKEKFVELFENDDLYIYVCGDASGMAKNVLDCITSILEDVKKISKDEAEKIMKQLQTEKRYLQDIWA